MSLLETALNVGGDLLSGYLGSKSASNAADIQAQALRDAQAVSAAGTAQGREDIMSTGLPGLEDLMAGFQGALGMLEAPGQAEMGALNLSGAMGAEAEQGAIDSFIDSPGQQWLRDQQEQALLRNASAIGGLGGGRVRSALQEQAFGRAATNQQQRFGNLSSLIMPEQQRASNLANILSGAGQSLSSFRGGLGANLANMATGGSARQADLLTDIGSAQAAGAMGGGNAWQSGIGNASTTLGKLYG